MKVGHAEQFLLAGGEPALTRLRLALGTVAVTAGVIGDDLMAALRTSIQMAAERRGTAVLQRSEHSQLLIAQPRSVLLDESLPLRMEQIGHLHGGPVHSGL